jgi:hypothetical protein
VALKLLHITQNFGNVVAEDVKLLYRYVEGLYATVAE